MGKKIVCPDCGGTLIFEELCQYGEQHKVFKNGKVRREFKKVDHGTMEAFYLFCKACNKCIDEDDYIFKGDSIDFVKHE